MDGDQANNEEKKCLTFIGKIKDIDTTNYTIDVVMSDETLDRYDEVVLAEGWDLKDYKKHPVLLSSHRYGGLLNQIGKSIKTRVENGELTAKLQYFVGEGNPEADWAFKLAEKGIAAFSVGFMPKTFVRQGDEDYDDILTAWKANGSGRKKISPRIFYTKSSLLENSQVLVPANPSALMKGLKDQDSFYAELCGKVKSLVDSGGIDDVLVEKRSYFDDVIERIKKLDDETKNINKTPADDGSGELEIKTTIPYKKYALIDPEAKWRIASARKRIERWAKLENDLDFTKYGSGFAYYESDVAELRDSYKLLHHDVENGEIKTHIRGTISAMAFLLTTKGEIEIPEDEKKGIYDHLAKHYEDFDKSAPSFKSYESREDIEAGCSDVATALELYFMLSLQKEESTEAFSAMLENGCKNLEKAAEHSLSEIRSLLTTSVTEIKEDLDLVIDYILDDEGNPKKKKSAQDGAIDDILGQVKDMTKGISTE